MDLKLKIDLLQNSDSTGHITRLHLLIFGLLLLSAFCIRLYHITNHPLDFAPIRQYQNATNTRALYFSTLEEIPEDRKKIADINAQRMGFALEPRIMEHLAVFGYRITGEEKLWIPRVLSSLFWIVGGIFLFLTTKKITSLNAALFSTVFYLFLPYGISASRSFQPDPLMIMMLMISLYTIVLHYEKPSKLRLITSSSISAFAIFVKPYCIFLIFGVFTALCIKRKGVWKFAVNSDFLLFSFISFMPSFIFYGYNSLIQSDAQAHIQGSFLPYLLLRPYFWQEWLIMIGRVTGYAAFAAALIGLFLSRALLRTILAGLWTGYLIFGLTFTYHIHTHDYYQMQLIPIVALSLIPIAGMILDKISSLSFSKKHLVVMALTTIVFMLASGYMARSSDVRKYKDYIKPLGAVIGVNPQFYQFMTGNYEDDVMAAQEIGELVGHSTNTVFLTTDYGRSLTYHGELSGLPWPLSISLRDRKEMGTPIPDKKELFNDRYLMIRTYKSKLFKGKKIYEEYIRYTPDYFIITDFKEFDMQPDLKEFLYNNFTIKKKSDSYLIFDMSRMSMS